MVCAAMLHVNASRVRQMDREATHRVFPIQIRMNLALADLLMFVAWEAVSREA